MWISSFKIKVRSLEAARWHEPFAASAAAEPRGCDGKWVRSCRLKPAFRPQWNAGFSRQPRSAHPHLITPRTRPCRRRSDRLEAPDLVPRLQPIFPPTDDFQRFDNFHAAPAAELARVVHRGEVNRDRRRTLRLEIVEPLKVRSEEHTS